MPDDPTLQAAMVGPLVLAGRLGAEGLSAATLRAEPTKPRTIPEYKAEPVAPLPLSPPLAPVPGRPLEFTGGAAGQGKPIAFVPFYRLFDERYGIYWRVT
jgi:uncharacterized protein